MDPQEETHQEDALDPSNGGKAKCSNAVCGWLGRLSRELHWSFILAVVSVYGACQGVGDAAGSVATGYYLKDVQRVQPSASQFYQGVVSAPWVVKPLWGLLTDVVPVAGYRRRPYLVLAGVMGVSTMLTISLRRQSQVATAVLALTARSAGAAIGDVTVDALVAQHSITQPLLAADMQSLCGFSSSVGALLGFSFSGLLVHAMGSQGVLGLWSIPSALVFATGILKWMPLLVLCSKLCPSGIEGTFYALLMSIQNAGVLTSSWWGGLLLHMLNVTRTEFSNLWVAVLIRNISRLLPLMLLFLIPQTNHNTNLLPKLPPVILYTCLFDYLIPMLVNQTNGNLALLSCQLLQVLKHLLLYPLPVIW